jgi:hypothetical protein
MKEGRMNYYDQLREHYRPDKISVLFIAESPPAQRGRFFYNPTVSEDDWLYLEIMSVLFHNLVLGVKRERSASLKNRLRRDKGKYLDCFKREGFWLQDAVPLPLTVNMDKGRAIRAYTRRTTGIVMEYRPEWCVLISRAVHDNLMDELKSVGARIMNPGYIPFPAYNHGCAFRKILGDLLLRNGVLPLEPC